MEVFKTWFLLIIVVSTWIMVTIVLNRASVYKGGIVHELTSRFNDDAMQCLDGDNNPRPAYECSGILIRGINHTTTKFPWSLKQGNKDRDSASFAFLRRDALFREFPMNYEVGFIMYPHLKTPSHKKVRNAWCAFPLDGLTNYREDRHGCGQNNNDTEGTSKPCDEQGITSYDTWLQHFNKIIANPDMKVDEYFFSKRGCGFNMTDQTAANNFAIALKAISYLTDSVRWFWSEVLARTWDENQPKEIPIQAFFFVLGNDTNREDKLRKQTYAYQSAYFKLTDGEMVPVIGIRVPTPQNPDLYIEYSNSYES